MPGWSMLQTEVLLKNLILKTLRMILITKNRAMNTNPMLFKNSKTRFLIVISVPIKLKEARKIKTKSTFYLTKLD